MTNSNALNVMAHEEEEDDRTRTPKQAKAITQGNNTEVQMLLAKLAEQERLIDQQRTALDNKEKELANVRTAAPLDSYPGVPSYNNTIRVSSGSSSSLSNDVSPDVSIDNSETYGYRPAAQHQNVHELNRLQTELQAAQSNISALNQELVQTRITNHTFDQALSPSRDGKFPLEEDVPEHTLAALQTAFAQAQLGQTARQNVHRTDIWTSSYEEPVAEINQEFHQGQSLPNGPYNRPSNIWGASSKSVTSQNPALPLTGQSDLHYSNPLRRVSALEPNDVYVTGNRGWNGSRSFTSQAGPPITGFRRSSYNPQAVPFRSGFDHGTIGGEKVTSNAYTPSPIGTPLSTSSSNEFAAATGNNSAIWGPQSQSPQQQTYISTMEPLNYRRLLERSVNCNWKYIVDKIVCNNDQQASIFLQQKLKIGTAEQKHAIVDAIVAQAYPLMINRFGNFLVQRCFEHGTSNQIDGIASAIRGNTLTLSMDAFGCHVIQKAFDCVSEDFKATMVAELLRRIPETVIHRYACHVWQKLFELRWTESPPQIMKYVNEALRGMWHEVALGETGSLVVQNIFENCLEEDKRPCIDEVLECINIIAHGQFGNWCIQHICEHGAPLDRTRAVDTVIQNAAEYSMDQYASKVVEKCLKIGGAEFLERYLDRVCEGRTDRPRIPLIDIASDQYGNYLVQWILQHASPQHKEQVAAHIRKHMVSLRGSKFGSRVGMLCCNPMYNRPAQGTPPAAAPRYSRYGYR
ncbi:ARM repeat-containing protein [Morchella conica CCBAS932]|uniref:ARM repeat-containing protein n=1 Tax=Morchella conica CCBAS932 TaxID=1392247 RepID=A0A3N4KYI0_9PEZI|nr:ARM repeat-containing protein [Morchella conica CCBAS932]